jgi:hypothetical protein
MFTVEEKRALLAMPHDKRVALMEARRMRDMHVFYTNKELADMVARLRHTFGEGVK